MASIAAIVLAAGGSARLGRSKQLLRFRGESLVRRAASTALAAGCRPVLVVLGADADAVRAELAGSPVRIVVHEDWSSGGIGGSIRRGAEALSGPESEIEGVILLTVDQYLLDTSVLAELLGRFDGIPGRVVAAGYAETHGVPAVFSASLLPELRSLSGARGARSLIRRQAALCRSVRWEAGAVDVDRPEDLAELRRREPKD